MFTLIALLYINSIVPTPMVIPNFNTALAAINVGKAIRLSGKFSSVEVYVVDNTLGTINEIKVG